MSYTVYLVSFFCIFVATAGSVVFYFNQMKPSNNGHLKMAAGVIASLFLSFVVVGGTYFIKRTQINEAVQVQINEEKSKLEVIDAQIVKIKEMESGVHVNEKSNSYLSKDKAALLASKQDERQWVEDRISALNSNSYTYINGVVYPKVIIANK